MKRIIVACGSGIATSTIISSHLSELLDQHHISYELIQCKRYRQGNNIGSTPIQRVHSYMRTRNASRAWVITTSDFTPEGRDEARITNVTIMNGHDLLQSLEIYYPGRFCL